MKSNIVIVSFLISLTVISCNTTKDQAARSVSLSVMSYNLRFDNPKDGVNAWDNRKDKLSNLVRFYQPAFMGTQEGQLHQLTYLKKRLAHYKWIGSGRDDGAKAGEFSAILYDTNRVKLVRNTERTIWLSKTPSKPGKGWDAAYPRILTYGKFHSLGTGRKFYVFNTHLDNAGKVARSNGARLIIKTIKKTAQGLPVILTGDFNAVPGSKPYSIITSQKTGLIDAYKHSALPPIGPDFTFEGFKVKGENEGRRIDYIFVNDKIKVNKFAVISSFRNDNYPSDHLPVIAEITLESED